MFDNRRYMTKGIESTLTRELVSFLWALIDEMRTSGHHIDYLQVFHFWPGIDATGASIQIVKHTQEQPEYQAVYNIYLPAVPINAKVYVIDDISHSTMLLASEY